MRRYFLRISLAFEIKKSNSTKSEARVEGAFLILQVGNRQLISLKKDEDAAAIEM